MTSLQSRRTAAVVPAAVTAAPVSLLIGAVPAAAEPLPVPTGGFQSGLYLPLNDWPVSRGESGALLLNGNLSLTWADTTVSPTVAEDGQLTALETELGLRGAVTLDVSAETSGDFDDTFELLTIPLGSFPAGPATITTYLGLTLRISGQADAGAQVGLVAPFNIKAALSGTGGRPTTSVPTAPAFDPEIGLPDLAGALAASIAIELEATLTFQISVPQLPLPIGGPVFATTVGAGLLVQPGVGPWWRLTANAGLKYGWSFPDAAGLPQPAQKMRNVIPRQEWQVARAHDAGPVGTTSTRWSAAYDVRDNGEIGGLLADGDSLTLIQRGMSTDSNPWLATLDGTGVPLSERQSTELTTFEGLARTPDGGAIGTGVSSVERFDSVGDSMWRRGVTLTDGLSTSWNAIVSTPDGTVMTGSFSDGVSSRPIVVGLDDDGNVRWASEIDLGAQYGRTALTALAAAADGSVIAVGSTADITDGAHDSDDLLVVRFEPLGSVRSTSIFGGDLTDTATAVAVHEDGSYVVAAKTTASSGGFDAVLARFSNLDQLMWSGRYRDSEPSNGSVIPTSITAIGHGDYVMCGTTGNIPDAWLMRIDSTGMPVWSKSFLGDAYDVLSDVVAMPTGVAAAGSSSTVDAGATTPDSTWIVRTAADGMVRFDPTSGMTTVNRAVQWSATEGWEIQPLTPTVTSPALSVTDERHGSEPATAQVRTLT